jgi:hypothetical protein
LYPERSNRPGQRTKTGNNEIKSPTRKNDAWGTRFILSLRVRATRHNKIVALVDSMLGLHKQLAAAKSNVQMGIVQRQIDATDRQIDQLVYQLYGLSDEDVALIENG